MVAVILARNWQLSWWEWHVLLALAFGFVAYSAYVQYRREGSSAGLFDAIGARRRPRARIRAEYGAALEDAGHRAAATEAGARRRRRSPRGWPTGSASPRARPRCSTGPARRWPPSAS